MAISTNAELLTAIDNFTDDTLGARGQELISLAESKINRNLRSLKQQFLATATYDTSATDRSIALPTAFIEMIDLAIKVSTDDDDEYDKLKITPPERLIDYYVTNSGQPYRFTTRNQLEFDRTADQTYTLRMHYLKMWDIGTDSTNWLLTNYPDVYLYGALAEAHEFLIETARATNWERKFDKVINELNDLDERTRDDLELSVADLSNMNQQRYGYNIYGDNY